MQSPETTPKSVYVYPLPAKTQGEHGNSKAYRISLWILWACFLLPIIGIVFVIDELIFSYISTNIFIIFFVIYFNFYKNSVFLYLVLFTVALFIPAVYATNFVTSLIPDFSPKGFGEGYPYFEFNFSIGIVLFIFIHCLNTILRIGFKKNISNFIAPIILCGVSSFFFYFICFAITGRIYQAISSKFFPRLPLLF